MSDRPKRKAIPIGVKREVVARQNGLCRCGCKREVHAKNHKATTRFDHHPALFLRLVNDAGDDYIPPQNDPDYIVARCLESDARKTGKRKLSGGTTAGSDANANAKQRRRESAPKFKRPIPSQKLKGRSTWPKRGPQKIRSGKMRAW